RGSQGLAFLLDVRPSLLLDEDHAGRARLRRLARPQGRGSTEKGAFGEGGRISGKGGRDLSVGARKAPFLPPIPRTTSGFFCAVERSARPRCPSATTRTSFGASTFCETGSATRRSRHSFAGHSSKLTGTEG